MIDFERALVTLAGARVRFVTITSKRVAGRPKDLQVLPELEALREIADENEG